MDCGLHPEQISKGQRPRLSNNTQRGMGNAADSCGLNKRPSVRRMGLRSSGYFPFLFFILLGLAQPSPAQTPQQWRDSLAVVNRQLSQNPQSVDLRLRKAAINIELQQWDYAIEEYKRVLRQDPKNLTAYYFRAYAYTHQQQLGLAKADYEAVLNIAPANMQARLGLATVCERMGRETEAMNHLNLLVQQFPDSAIVYATRAAFETQRKQWDVALYDWNEAISRDPRNADYVATMADLLLALGRRGEARKQLEQAVERGVPRSLLYEWFRRTGSPSAP